MNRQSFKHTERPTGSTPPMTANPRAINAISSLAKRGSANIQGDQLRKPVQGNIGQPVKKPPSPVALEALSRMKPQGMPQQMQPLGQQMAQPMGQPMGQPPVDPFNNPAIQPLPQQQQPPMEEGHFERPPVDGYFSQKLAELVAQNPQMQQEWSPVLERFGQIRTWLQEMRKRVFDYRSNMGNA